MKLKKIAVALAAGLTLGTMFVAPVTASVSEAASESVMKLKSPAETYATQGEKLFNEGKFEEAGEAFRNAAKEDEKNDEYWFRAGKAFYKAEKFISAADCIKKAVKLKPDNGNYNKWLGVAYWKQIFQSRNVSKDTLIERATKYTGRAAELMPNDIDAQLTAGIIQEKAANYYQGLSRSGWFMAFPGAIEKDFRKAYQYYRRAVEIDPNNAKNVATLDRFINENSNYGFQPYKPATPPAPQPTPDLPGEPNDWRASGNLRSLIYVPRQSQTATLAFSQYDWEGLAEVYRNPYKDGGEYVIINTYIAEDGKTCFSPYRNGFDYIPDDPDDPGAGGEFLFTGGFMREDELDRYYMRARVEGETIKVEWLIGDRQSGPQRREKDVLYPEDTYGLQPVTDAILDKGFFSIKNMSYRFVSNRGIYKDDRCVLNDDYAPAITTMFAFLDFLNEGNTLDSIVEPPPGITLPSYGRLKQPELYRKPTLTF